MHTIDTAITMMVAGAQYRQYLPQVTGCPFLAATDVPTTLAEAPMGVALPPRSVPMDRAHARTCRSTPWVWAIAWITGTMVAAKGILSTKALATADTHRMMATITTALPPLSLAMPSANTPRQPVRSSPATTTNSPVKNSSVL